MQQPQRNLFFSYRGSTSPDPDSDYLFERQLEDNATKALIYVLERADRTCVLQRFLTELVGIRLSSPTEEIQFALQRVDIRRPNVAARIALSIAPSDSEELGSGAGHLTGRPDAWIWCDGSFAVLIETKVRGSATEEQMNRHIRGASGWGIENSERRCLSWGAVYDFFVSILHSQRHSDPITKLLLQEFVGYMRMTALASGTAFDLEDFGFFLRAPEERDDATRALLMRKLIRFTGEFSESAAVKEIASYYADGDDARAMISPGKFRRDSANYWITISPKERRDKCHFTVRLGEDGLSLEAFSPHKSFTERFIEKIAMQRKAFLESLASIDRRALYKLRLREAYYADPESSYKGRRIAGRVDFLEIQPRMLNEANLSALLIDPVRSRLNSAALRPEICLVRHFRIGVLLRNSDPVRLVTDAARPMLGYLRFALEL